MNIAATSSLRAFAQSSPSAAGGVCASQVGASIDQILQQPENRRSRFGVLVETLTGGNVLYSNSHISYFTPASTTKLLTTAAALEAIGPDYRLRTSVYGTLNGPTAPQLRLVGSSDPTIDAAKLQSLAQQLAARGIMRVDRLIVQEAGFTGPTINPTWQWEDIQSGYGAPVNSLIYNQNAVEIMLWPTEIGQPLLITWANPEEAGNWRIENTSKTVAPDQPEFVEVGRDFREQVLKVSGQLRFGSEPEDAAVAVVDPGSNFLRHFRAALQREGITVGTATVSTTDVAATPGEIELAAVESPTLAELVTTTNQTSNNLYAEVLLRLLGVNGDRNQTAASTAIAGVQAAKTTLTRLGVDPQSYFMQDGSGLSRQNLVSPLALVETLRGMARSEHAAIYRAGLPTSGVSGVQAKTGGMTGVSSEAGYVEAAAYEPLAFAIIVNNSERLGADRRKIINEIVLLLSQLRRC
ncbi:MAG: D-alanyl-D-alanine carboxypeptidase/D-alanyl-D-alanine-endopeptidase [Oscillatoriaceae cyanobacterium]